MSVPTVAVPVALRQKVSGRKLESSQIRFFVWFSTLIFPFDKYFS